MIEVNILTIGIIKNIIVIPALLNGPEIKIAYLVKVNGIEVKTGAQSEIVVIFGMSGG